MADLGEQSRLLRLMMGGVYVDVITTRKVVGIAPKPGFRKFFEAVVTTAKNSGVTILTPKKRPATGPFTNEKGGCGGRGGGEPPVQKKWPKTLLQAYPAF